MSVLILIKWALPWTPAGEYKIEKSPSIISIFIKMVLEPGKWPSVNFLPKFLY